MPGLRTRIARSERVVAARTVAGLAAAPPLRRRLARSSHAGRLAWARRLVPGSLGQVPDEIVSLAELAAASQPVRVCEIGTLDGGTSLFLCGLAPSVRLFVGIDLEPHNTRLVSALAPADVDVRFVRGSSRDQEVRDALTGALDGELLDLLFIDGDHAYDGVRADLLGYRSLVRPGGLIAFHDIVPSAGGPAWAWSGGVPELWNEIKGSFRNWELVGSDDQQGFGIGVIEHDPSVEI